MKGGRNEKRRRNVRRKIKKELVTGKEARKKRERKAG